MATKEAAAGGSTGTQLTHLAINNHNTYLLFFPPPYEISKRCHFSFVRRMNAIKGHHVHHHPNHIDGNVHGERGMVLKTGKHKLTNKHQFVMDSQANCDFTPLVAKSFDLPSDVQILRYPAFTRAD